jgi:carboxymethylenebutenolidase
MQGDVIQVPSPEGSFDCYVSLPHGNCRGPGIVMAPSVFGVNEDLSSICDNFAKRGFVCAAPDIFWRGDKGPLARDDEGQRRAMARVSDKTAIYGSAVKDFGITLEFLRKHESCNGRSAIFGFCFGGPFAVLGITTLGCDAGASFHGSNFEDQLGNLQRINRPLQLHWGDDDFALSTELLSQVRNACTERCTIFIYPGVKRAYTSATSPAHDALAAGQSWERSAAMLKALQ